MKARNVISRSYKQTFYRVKENWWNWLYIEICSRKHFKNPMILRVMKNQVLKIAKQPSRIEKAYELTQEDLFELTQEVAVVS
jgi:hypothetical protein